MTLPEQHLSEDALAAYVDGILSHTADERAAKHLRTCAECRTAVDAEREAKALLGATPDPTLPVGLLAKLLDVPMTADIGSTDQTLAIEGDKLGWSTSDSKVMKRRATTAPARPRPSARPGGATRPAGRSTRSRRARRGLAVSLAGLAFGVIATAASTSANSAAPARPGEVPQTRLVVGTSTPMDLTRTFLFRRSPSLPTAPTPAP